MMNLLIFAFVLAFLPVINWIAEYFFPKKDRQLHHFKNHFTCYYLDLLLIIFNFFAAFAMSFNLALLPYIVFAVVLISLILYP